MPDRCLHLSSAQLPLIDRNSPTAHRYERQQSLYVVRLWFGYRRNILLLSLATSRPLACGLTSFLIVGLHVFAHFFVDHYLALHTRLKMARTDAGASVYGTLVTRWLAGW